jgi:hypothetical protein
MRGGMREGVRLRLSIRVKWADQLACSFVGSMLFAMIKGGFDDFDALGDESGGSHESNILLIEIKSICEHSQHWSAQSQEIQFHQVVQGQTCSRLDGRLPFCASVWLV